MSDTNNNLLITKDRVKAWSACTDGYRWFLANFPQGAEFAEVYAALRADKRYSDSDWLSERVFSELDTPTKVRQTVFISGADANKIKAAADAGSEAATTGEWANAATTGHWANAATTGNWANAATTGHRANAATTGEGANAATTGNWANAATTGEGAVSASLGTYAKAKSGKGGAIVLAHRKPDGSLIGIFSSMVGENGIKPDVWYEMSESGPVEVSE